MRVLAATAILIGFWGAFATGCMDLSVGPSLSKPDSLVGTEGLDEPGETSNPGGNIVPAER